MAKHVKSKKVPRDVMIRALVTRELAEKLEALAQREQRSLRTSLLKPSRPTRKSIFDASTAATISAKARYPTRWCCLVCPHGSRSRIRAAFGTAEFDAEYQAALAGNPRPRKPGVEAGSLAWLMERYR